MEEDEYLGRIAATVLREHFAASPAERGADGTDARADAAATASDAQCVAGLLEMLFDAMIVVEDVLGLSNSIKLLEETNVQLEGVEVASQAGGAPGAPARAARAAGRRSSSGRRTGRSRTTERASSRSLRRVARRSRRVACRARFRASSSCRRAGARARAAAGRAA